jgi:hypothetical protein
MEVTLSVDNFRSKTIPSNIQSVFDSDEWRAFARTGLTPSAKEKIKNQVWYLKPLPAHSLCACELQKKEFRRSLDEATSARKGNPLETIPS